MGIWRYGLGVVSEAGGAGNEALSSPGRQRGCTDLLPSLISGAAQLSDPSGPALPVAANLAVRQQRTLLTLQVWGASVQGQGPSTWIPGCSAGHRGDGGSREAARPPLLPAADGGPGWRPEQGAGGGVTGSSRFGGLALRLIGLYVQFAFFHSCQITLIFSHLNLGRISKPVSPGEKLVYQRSHLSNALR